jgi:hypothetical protein
VYFQNSTAEAILEHSNSTSIKIYSMFLSQNSICRPANSNCARHNEKIHQPRWHVLKIYTRLLGGIVLDIQSVQLCYQTQNIYFSTYWSLRIWNFLVRGCEDTQNKMCLTTDNLG